MPLHTHIGMKHTSPPHTHLGMKHTPPPHAHMGMKPTPPPPRTRGDESPDLPACRANPVLKAAMVVSWCRGAALRCSSARQAPPAWLPGCLAVHTWLAG